MNHRLSGFFASTAVTLLTSFSIAQDLPSVSERERAAIRLANSEVGDLQRLPERIWIAGLSDESEIVVINHAHALAKLERTKLSRAVTMWLGEIVSRKSYAARTQGLGVLVHLEESPSDCVIAAIVEVAIAKQWKASDLAVETLVRWQPPLDLYADRIIASALRSARYSDRERSANLLPLLKLADRGFGKTVRALVAMLDSPTVHHSDLDAATGLIQPIGPAAAPVALPLFRRGISMTEPSERYAKVAMVHAMRALEFTTIPDDLKTAVADVSEGELDPVDYALIAEIGYNQRRFWPKWRQVAADLELLTTLSDCQLDESFLNQLERRGVSLAPTLELARRKLGGSDLESEAAAKVGPGLGRRAVGLVPDIWRSYRMILISTNDRGALYRMLSLLNQQPLAESVEEAMLADIREVFDAPDFGRDLDGDSPEEYAAAISGQLGDAALPLLNTGHPEIRLNAVHLIRAVAEWTGSRVSREMIGKLFVVALRDSSSAVRSYALFSIESLRLESCIPQELLVELQADPIDPLREFAVIRLLNQKTLHPLSGCNGN